MRNPLQFVCGLALFAAILYSWLWTLSFSNRVYIYRHRAGYRPDIFLVSDAHYSRGEESDSWWLKGTVSGQEEILVPRLSGASIPRSATDLLLRYPVGTRINVQYNPDATRTVVQNESLRVQEAGADFWQEEAALRRRLGVRVLLPVPITLGLYVGVRYSVRRRQILSAK